MALEMQSRWGRITLFCIKNALPLGVVVALAWALVWPFPGEVISKPKLERYRVVSTINILIIFVISGLTLNTDDFKKAIGKGGRWGFIYGVVSILGITGCLGFLVVAIPFDVKEFSYGLAVFCVVPNAMSSGVIFVMNAGGNDALALLLTVTTSLLGAFTVPFFVKAVVNAGGAKFDAVDLLVKLIIILLVPLAIGKVIREIVPGAQAWVRRFKVYLSLTNSIMAVMIVWQALSRGQKNLTSVSLDHILYIFAAGIVLHVIYLSINYAICRFVLRLQRRELKAVVLLSSSKSLAVAVTVVSFLGDVGKEGLMMIPCIMAHLSQIFIDSYISSRWGSESEAAKEGRAAAVVGPKPRDDVEAIYAPSNDGKKPATV